jgi:hypothetical protein
MDRIANHFTGKFDLSQRWGIEDWLEFCCTHLNMSPFSIRENITDRSPMRAYDISKTASSLVYTDPMKIGSEIKSFFS